MKTMVLIGDLLPWKACYHSEHMQIKLHDPLSLALEIVPKKDDNFVPLRHGIANIYVATEKEEYKKKVDKWCGREVEATVSLRRFDGYCCDEGPEHGWSLDLISLKRKKSPPKTRNRFDRRKGRKT
jgi:hypothetical protein